MTTTAPRKRAARKPRAAAEPVKEPVAEVVEHDEVVDEVLEDALDEASAEAPVLDVAEQKAKYVAARKLTFRGVEYQAGEPVPGAEEILRIETWVTHRYLKEA